MRGLKAVILFVLPLIVLLAAGCEKDREVSFFTTENDTVLTFYRDETIQRYFDSPIYAPPPPYRRPTAKLDENVEITLSLFYECVDLYSTILLQHYYFSNRLLLERQQGETASPSLYKGFADYLTGVAIPHILWMQDRLPALEVGMGPAIRDCVDHWRSLIRQYVIHCEKTAATVTAMIPDAQARYSPDKTTMYIDWDWFFSASPSQVPDRSALKSERIPSPYAKYDADPVLPPYTPRLSQQVRDQALAGVQRLNTSLGTRIRNEQDPIARQRMQLQLLRYEIIMRSAAVALDASQLYYALARSYAQFPPRNGESFCFPAYRLATMDCLSPSTLKNFQYPLSDKNASSPLPTDLEAELIAVRKLIAQHEAVRMLLLDRLLDKASDFCSALRDQS